jgi:hypothetical protein
MGTEGVLNRVLSLKFQVLSGKPGWTQAISGRQRVSSGRLRFKLDFKLKTGLQERKVLIRICGKSP